YPKVGNTMLQFLVTLFGFLAMGFAMVSTTTATKATTKVTPTKATPTKATPTKATPKATPKATKCQYCGKRISKSNTLKAGHGMRCAAIQKKFGSPTKALAQRVRLTLPGIPPGYIKTAALHKHIVAQALAGKTMCKVSSMVRAFGTDKGYNAPTHPIAQFYYIVGNRARYISAWCGTPAGLQAMASGDFGKAPTPPTTAQLQTMLQKGTKPAYKIYNVRLQGQ
ncbi:hypothetical protein LCGC14_2961390, partial [marine sediment metagenome]